ncbi:Mg(2+) chelatase family protein [Gracilibacillus boraciitolerans JCM 21714]|uniref:Mg(2+) chelatase family protein n=1 Tax=Gracilibacillus boraciitolerans JCM 21714 TaxID=1298598 RepID=W4VN71_9BACI|nr:Mg(2+) chelatase family protein [Gracilibacillus boraciitolerans JCM 21714]
MTTIVSSVGLKGMEGYPVQVEVQTMPGTYGGVKIIGLPSSAVKESKDRVLAALYANKCPLAHQKVIVQLSPEEERKNSPLFDLAMAIAIMKENGVLKAEIPKDAAFIGVLSLDGTIQSLDAMLPAIMAVKKLGFTKVFLPPFPQRDLIYFKGLEICYVTSLREMQDVLSGQLSMSSTLSSKHTSSINTFSDPPTYDNDFQHILGHQKAKRALEIAAAGGHHVLMIGPPGCGKSLLAETFPSIFPTLELEDQLEVQSMYLLSDIKRSDTRIAPFEILIILHLPYH